LHLSFLRVVSELFFFSPFSTPRNGPPFFLIPWLSWDRSEPFFYKARFRNIVSPSFEEVSLGVSGPLEKEIFSSFCRNPRLPATTPLFHVSGGSRPSLRSGLFLTPVIDRQAFFRRFWSRLRNASLLPFFKQKIQTPFPLLSGKTSGRPLS